MNTEMSEYASLYYNKKKHIYAVSDCFGFVSFQVPFDFYVVNNNQKVDLIELGFEYLCQFKAKFKTVKRKERVVELYLGGKKLKSSIYEDTDIDFNYAIRTYEEMIISMNRNKGLLKTAVKRELL